MNAERKVEFHSADGFSLVGRIAAPTNTHGWVILTHGITETKDEYGGFYIDLARRFQANGIGTLRFDFRGHGESGGTSLDVSVLGDVLDVKAAVAQLPLGEMTPLGFVGTSFGAAPAILAATELARKPVCMALVAPVLDYRRTFLEPETEWGREWFSRDSLARMEKSGFVELDGYKLSPRLFEEFHFLDPVTFLAALHRPTLIVHGDRDTVVPFATSELVASRVPLTRLHKLHDADHGYPHFEDETGSGPESSTLKHELIDTVVDFVLRHFSEVGTSAT